MDFRQARSEYLRLRHAYRSGQISPDEFEKQANSMIVSSKGHKWVIGVKSGKWYRREGNRWIEDVPEIDLSETTSVVQNKSSKKNGQSIIGKLRSVLAPKPVDPGKDITFHRMARGLVLAFLVLLLAVIVVIGLMMKGEIETPAEVSSLFPGMFNSSKEDAGIGSAETAETFTTLSAYLQAAPASENSTDSSGSLNGFMYSKEIRATWVLRDQSNETLVIKKDGSIRIFSTVEKYEYTGKYIFTDDHTIRFMLDNNTASAAIWIDANVLTLEINGLPLVYDKAK